MISSLDLSVPATLGAESQTISKTFSPSNLLIEKYKDKDLISYSYAG